MDATHTPSPDASSTDAAVSLATAPAQAKRIGWAEGHLPDIVEPLDPQDPDTAFTETRRLRQDGWTPDRQRTFLSRLAECGVIKEACIAAGMSARAAYNLRDRDTLFAAGWEAACVMARPRLADEAFSRSMNGVVERIYRDGVVVAERHRYDNRLTMAVLARLDSRVDRAEERGDPHLALVARWDDFLDALGEDRRDDGLALLEPETEPEPETDVHDSAGDRELHELHHSDAAEMEAAIIAKDRHDVWETDEGWWTDYPPPAGFDGDEQGKYGAFKYRRTLTPEEQAVVDADLAAEDAARRSLGEAQRLAFFYGVGDEAEEDSG